MKYYKIISKLLEDLETKKREDGSEFVTCKEDSPLLEVICNLHDGMFPNDWIFKKTEELLISMDENWETDSVEDLRDSASISADSCTDIYNSDLLDWSKTFYHYIDDSIGEFGADRDFIGLVSQGQFYQLDLMAHQLVDLISELTEEGE